MSYPEPIPAIRGEGAEEFLRRLGSFKLTPEQRKFFRGARETYQATVRRGEARKPPPR